ncbi:hypothetical protein D9M71_428300 [compost metagenome]
MIEVETGSDRQSVRSLEERVSSAEKGPPVRETSVIPFIEILSSDRQRVGHLGFGGNLTDRQEDFLGLDTRTGNCLNPIRRSLRIGNCVSPKQ